MATKNHTIKAHTATTNMHYMDGSKGRKICEVHTDKMRRTVLLVWYGPEGEFVRKEFGFMHRVKVRH